jgi:hypothetical protein
MLGPNRPVIGTCLAWELNGEGRKFDGDVILVGDKKGGSFSGLIGVWFKARGPEVLHPRDTRYPIPDFFGEIQVSTRYPNPRFRGDG